MKCIKCQGDIPDGSRFCSLCGIDQQDIQKEKEKVGVLIFDCQHCGGAGECSKGKTRQKIHSCEYCITKAEAKLNSMFPHVPCAYCKNGKIIIDLKMEKPQNEQKPQQGKGK